MTGKIVEIGYFLTERIGRFKPNEANKSGLKRIEKIDFSGNIFIIGKKPTKTDMILIKKDDLVISGINAEKGAISVYQGNEEILATIHYSSYIYDKNKINIEYLRWFLKSPKFQELLLEQSGNGIKTEIKAKKFLKLKVFLPGLKDQERILEKINNVNNEVIDLQKISFKNLNYTKQLKQSILQEAIEGKLTQSWRDNHKDVEPASILLKRIKKGKEELIKKGELKKQKSLKEITPEEIPFKIPKTWSWCRLGDVVLCNPRNKLKDELNVSFIPMKLIEDGFANKHGSEIKKWREIKSGFTHFKERDVVFAKITPCFQNRKSAVLNNLINGYGAGTTELIVLRSYDELILPELILLFVKTDSFIDLGVCTYTGTAGQQRVSKEKLLDVVFPLPPLEEQKEIVKKVEEYMKLCDELEAQTMEAKANTENLMKSILAEVFTEKKKTVEEDTNKKENNMFLHLQGIAGIIDSFQKNGCARGEVGVTKCLSIIQSIYGIDYKMSFTKNNFGPFHPDVKVAITSGIKQKYFKRNEYKALELGEKSTYITDKGYDIYVRTKECMKDLINKLNKAKFFKTDEIELLATILKIVSDEKSLDYNIIVEGLKNWKVKDSGNKWNKFKNFDIQKYISFISDNNWDNVIL